MGAGNALVFYLFIVLTWLVCSVSGALSAYALLTGRVPRSSRQAVVGLGTFTVVMGVALAFFVAMHASMALSNSTTYEQARYARYHDTGVRCRVLASVLAERARVLSSSNDELPTLSDDEQMIVRVSAQYRPMFDGRSYDRGSWRANVGEIRRCYEVCSRRDGE